jgi:Xaa-Pro aminopeptidase
MAAQHIDVYVHVNSDPHMSEYLPDHWKCIAWATGFTGEVATLVLTQDEAALWTDSRFFVQAEKQLEGTGVELMRLGMPQTVSVRDYIGMRQPQLVGYDGRVLSQAVAQQYFHGADGEPSLPYKSDVDLFEHAWTDRPALPKGPLELYPASYAGESTRQRLQRIEQQLAGAHKTLLLTRLDDIAWAFNVRGTDIHCTPVCNAFALIDATEWSLYVDPAKVDDATRATLEAEGVCVHPYSAIYEGLAARIRAKQWFVANEEDLSMDLAEHLKLAQWDRMRNPIAELRAVKNETELVGYRNAMEKDGVALTRFYRRLERELAAGHKVTELDCVDWLIEARREQPLYREESFDAIVAWGEHAAMPHYYPTAESNVAIEGDGLLLIDTGGQYLDGTTDITRTVALGTLTDEMCADYTRVLKGHIRLAQARFPKGTRGDQLDVLARIDLWQCGKTYRHGTSHGVGHYLCVHEGPESIRMEHNPQVLLENMVLSNEPAVYLPGHYGIRHENCVTVRPYAETEDGTFFELETLTLFPIDTTPIVREMLTAEEVAWLNEYHQRVYDRLAPALTTEEAEWLRDKTATI